MTANFRMMVVAGAALLILVGVHRVWQDQHPNRDGRVLVLDARSGAILGERHTSGGWVVAALLPHGQVAVAAADSCEEVAIEVLDDRLRPVGSARKTAVCGISTPNELRGRLSGTSPVLLDDFWATSAGMNFTLGSGRLLATHDGRLIAFDHSGRKLWSRAAGGPTGIVDVGQGRVVVPIPGSYTPAPGA